MDHTPAIFNLSIADPKGAKMKRTSILILILFSVPLTARAQDAQEQSAVEAFNYFAEPPLFQVNVIRYAMQSGRLVWADKIQRPEKQIDLVGLYHQYKKECYNDSTLRENTDFQINWRWKQAMPPFEDDSAYVWTMGENETLTRVPRNCYAHRSPTLDGFMEWIERNFK